MDTDRLIEVKLDLEDRLKRGPVFKNTDGKVIEPQPGDLDDQFCRGIWYRDAKALLENVNEKLIGEFLREKR